MGFFDCAAEFKTGKISKTHIFAMGFVVVLCETSSESSGCTKKHFSCQL